MKRTKNERKQARMDFRDDYDRESYIALGHEPEKVDLGIVSEDRLRQLTEEDDDSDDQSEE